ncbi:MAG: hypothetical protein ACXWQ5_07595 [Ktedonobacterales bacterium]
MAVQHPKRPPEIPELLGALARHGVRYVLTGSVAALAYGVEIGQAGDLDITPALDEVNLSRLGALLRDIEASLDPDGPMGHWETLPDGEKKWRVDAPTRESRAQQASWSPDPADVSTFDHLFCTRLGNFDVVPEVSGTYETLMKRAARMDAWGHDIWVVHVDELLAALTVPRRAKDVPRVRQLREIQRRRGERGERG